MYNWQTSVRYIKGIGPTRSKELVTCGITTVGELLCRQPLSYLYPGTTTIKDAQEGQTVIRAKVRNVSRGWGSTVVGTLDDETGTCRVVWYYASHILQALRPGMTATFYGKFKGGTLAQPRWTTVESTMESVYGGQYGVHHDTIRAALKEVLYSSDTEYPPMADGRSRKQVFKSFHFPQNKIDLCTAEVLLKQDESLQLQLALAERRRGREQDVTWAHAMEWNDEEIDSEIIAHFPFIDPSNIYGFTEDQNAAISSVVADLQKTIPMQRLIHGEVGSGKTAVAFYAAMLTALNSKRTLILCPTTILAQQHWDTLHSMGWLDLALYYAGEEKVKAGEYAGNIVIGTHAMLNNESLLKSASLVIIDEFQKFGVEQRAKATKNNPHLLLLSATPIPRTLAATVFGDLDVSVIRELPIKRGTVVTKWVLPD